jgi:hypothetical protein
MSIPFTFRRSVQREGKRKRITRKTTEEMGSKRRRNSENYDYGVVRTRKKLNFNFNIS